MARFVMTAKRREQLTVLQVVSHAAGSANRRSVGGPERRALASLDFWDYDRFRIVVTYGHQGRLRQEFESKAATRDGVTLVPFAAPRRRDWRALITIARIIRRHSVDVVHSQGPHGTDWWAATAARLSGVAAVVTRPVALCDYGLSDSTFRRFRRLDRLALRRAHAMVFVAEEVRQRSIRCGVASPSRSRVILNGVDLRRFHPTDAPTTRRVPTFGMIGQLLPVKDWPTFLEVCARVFAVLPQSRALIVGDGPEDARIRRAIADRNWQDRVCMTGFQADVTGPLADMDVFTLTSRREGLPVSIIEAMAMARPVVATAVGGVPEIVRHDQTGFLCEEGNAEQLAAGIIRLLQDPDLRSRFGRAAREDAERRLSIQSMVRAYQNLYLEAAGHQPPPADLHST